MRSSLRLLAASSIRRCPASARLGRCGDPRAAADLSCLGGNPPALRRHAAGGNARRAAVARSRRRRRQDDRLSRKLRRWFTTPWFGSIPSGRPMPSLASSWQQESEHRWRFTLRTGVHFSDGTALTPAAGRAVAARSQSGVEPPRRRRRGGHRIRAAVARLARRARAVAQFHRAACDGKAARHRPVPRQPISSPGAASRSLRWKTAGTSAHSWTPLISSSTAARATR